MKNISIRKGIGLLYLGLSIVFTSAAYSTQKVVESSSSPYFITFVLMSILSFICLVSFAIWFFTKTALSKGLGYFISILIILTYFTLYVKFSFSSNGKIVAFFIFLGTSLFLFLISHSKISSSNRNEFVENNKILDSQVFDVASSYKIPNYFWSVSRIYAITLAIFNLPLFMMALYSSNAVKGYSSWEVGIFLFFSIIAALFWIKPKWGKWIFTKIIILTCIVSLVIASSYITGLTQIKLEGFITSTGLCLLSLGLLLILISKEAKAELESFEQQKKSTSQLLKSYFLLRNRPLK